jgi:LytR cell envelope-related transcriptional attenuator
MDLILAFSLQDQVEKYGAYVGLAAFLGLAVLSLLYFAQARELKRLRDWAGRAPERAQELEARVVAQAEEALREPEPSGTVGPAVPVAKPVAAPASGNGRQAGTPAPIPMGPRPAIALAALAAEAPQATVEAPALPDEEEEEEEAAVAPTGDGPAASDGDRPGDVPAVTDGDRPAAPADEEAAPPADEADEPEVEEEREPEPAGSGNGVPAEPPTQIPRATPRPQPRPAPAPKPVPAAPLRASSTRSATLAPRRTARRPQRDAGSSRAGLYTVVGIVVLAVAILVPVYFTVLSDDEPTPPPNPVEDPGGAQTTGTGAGGRAAEARPEKVVVVLNGTPVDGLASDFRDELLGAGYSDEQGMIRIDNSDDQQRQDSVVYYDEDERRQARDVSRLLDITRTEQIDEETKALADSSDETGTLPADVVVVLGADKSP